MLENKSEKKKKKAINLTIREDVLLDAKSLNLNTSKAAEAGIMAAIKQAQETQWLKENKPAIEAYNKRIAAEGLLIQPLWQTT